MKRLFIRKANDLIEAKCKLGLEEQKIMNFLIAQIQYEDAEFREYEVTVDDFCNATGCKKDGVYARLLAVGKILTSTTLYLETGKRLTVLSWLSEAHYYKGEARLTFTFAPSLKPLLLELQKHGSFTKYEFDNIKHLNSVYSVRIYELLKEYENFKREEGKVFRVFEVNELKEKLDVSDKYKNYNDFKKYVLIQAREEIHKRCDIYFEFEEIKKGRKISQIRFDIFKQPKNNVISIHQAKPEPSQTTAPPYSGWYGEQLFFLKELRDSKNPDADAEVIYKEANGNMDLIRRRYEYIKTWKHIGNFVGAMITSIRKTDAECHMPISVNNGSPSKFHNFTPRVYDFDELERLELEQFRDSLTQ
jgi:plasmid replication initiation protein